MDEKIGRLQSIDYRHVFAWTGLFRAFRIAVDLRKMLLAAIALALIAGGQRMIAALPFADERPTLIYDQAWTSHNAARFDGPPVQNPLQSLWVIAKNGRCVLMPLTTFTEPARVLLSPGSTIAQGAVAWTQLFWTLLVWSLFGGAMTRMVAVEFARDERIGMRQALRFAARKLMSYFTAPLLPIGGVALFWLLGLLIGLVGRVPVAGEIVVGAALIVPLIFGLVMALILLGVAAGWPLMYAAISTEGSDAFDGFSRSFSYVFGRPWHYLWYAAVALAYGFVVVCFILLIATLMLYLTGWSLAGAMGLDKVVAMSQTTPGLIGGPELFTPISKLSPGDMVAGGESLGSDLAGMWLNLVGLLIAGFVYSYFWTAATIIYFLLRRVDDATDLDEVFIADEEEDDDLLPLVGVAASEQPVVERPSGGAVTASDSAELGARSAE